MRRELHLVAELETLCELINSSKVCQVTFVVVVVNLLVLLVLVVLLTVFLSVIFTALQIARKSFYCVWPNKLCAEWRRKHNHKLVSIISRMPRPLPPVKHLAKFCLLRR